jgi:hypothetical protein
LALSGFSFLSEATDVPTKTTDLAKGQKEYFNIQAENTTDVNSISANDMKRQSVINENSLDYDDGAVINNHRTSMFFAR